MPGMVLDLSAFKDSYPTVFGGGPKVKNLDLAVDLPMFSFATVVLGNRSKASFIFFFFRFWFFFRFGVWCLKAI